MSKIICNCCSKKINVPTGRALKVCKACGAPACKGCMTKLVCKECAPLSSAENQINDYFKDKYETRCIQNG